MKLSNDAQKRILLQCSYEIVGPVVFDFVRWVLDMARKKNITTLYFLARDGYILHQIATMIVKYEKIPISCKYLYCSRRSLRIPSYHLVGEEAYDLLSLGGYHITLDSLLDRGGITEDSKRKVLHELGVADEECTRYLLKREAREYAQCLRENQTYRAAVTDVSESAYPETIGYLRQEGLFEQKTVAVVDSGWTGSMQRSLRQLLESGGFTGKMVGFYFGMYAEPKDGRDGEYLTYCFDKSGPVKEKVLFCNNLFECILSAPHGMTMSYQWGNGYFEPCLGQKPHGRVADLIQTQIDGIIAYVTEQLPSCVEKMDWDAALARTRKLLCRLMSKPTQEEAMVYGRFQFDDDIADGNTTALAGKEQIQLLREYLIPVRILRKLRKRGSNTPELFWAYGTVVFLPRWKRWWYWWNVALWEWMKYTLKP